MKKRSAFIRKAVLVLTVMATVGTIALNAQAATKIGLVQINQQALFFTQMNEGAMEAAKAAGVDLAIFNANNDPAAQNDAIETYIQDKVDALLVVAIDVNGIKPAVTAAKKAGIPVVAIDAIIDGDNDAQIGVDNKMAGVDIGKHMGEYIKSELKGTAQVGIIGALNSFIQNVRLDGFKEGLAAAVGDQAKIVDTVDGQNVQDVAQTASENLMTANPDMDLVYATGEPALIGAIAATISQNAQSRVRVFGWDLTAQAIKAIDEGWVTAVVQQDPKGMGSSGVETALKLLKGEKVEKNIAIPITIVTKENVAQFRSMFE
jgi:ribose transport system substrate-binding protein